LFFIKVRAPLEQVEHDGRNLVWDQFPEADQFEACGLRVGKLLAFELKV